MVPPGFFAPAFPYMPMAPFQAMGMAAPPAADNKEGMKALECLMSLLVDEMRDVKRGLTGLHQEFAELRKKHDAMEKEMNRPTTPAASPSFYPLPEQYQGLYSDLFVQLPFLSRYPLFNSQHPFIVDDPSKPIIAFKILEHRGVVPPVIAWANDKFLDQVGFTLAELVELPLLKLAMIDLKVTRQLHALVREPAASLMGESVPITPLTVSKDGNMVRLSMRLQVFFGSSKQPKWAVAIMDGIEEDSRVHYPVSWIPGLPRWWQRMAVEAAQGAAEQSLINPGPGQNAADESTNMDHDFSELIAQLMGSEDRFNS
jgi:hypothetical protein